MDKKDIWEDGLLVGRSCLLNVNELRDCALLTEGQEMPRRRSEVFTHKRISQMVSVDLSFNSSQLGR